VPPAAADLPDRRRHRGTVYLEQHRQRRVRQIVPQVNQRDQHPVHKHQTMLRAGAGFAAAIAAAPLPQLRLLLRLPCGRKLSDEFAKALLGDAG